MSFSYSFGRISGFDAARFAAIGHRFDPASPCSFEELVGLAEQQMREHKRRAA